MKILQEDLQNNFKKKLNLLSSFSKPLLSNILGPGDLAMTKISISLNDDNRFLEI